MNRIYKAILLFLVAVAGVPAYAATYLNDTFTGTAGTALDSHTGETGATWTKHTSFASSAVVITDANRIRSNTASASVYYSSGTPAAALRQDVTAVMRFKSLAGTFAGVTIETDTAANTFYWVMYSVGSTGWQVWKNVAGSSTQIGGTYSDSPGADTDRTLRVLKVAHTIFVFIDGTLRITLLDNAITAAGRVGIVTQGAATNTTGIHFDSLAASDATAPAKRVVFDGNSLIFGQGLQNDQNLTAQVMTSLGSTWEGYTFGVSGQRWDQMSSDAATQIDTLYTASPRTCLVVWEDTNSIVSLDNAASVKTDRDSYNSGRKTAGYPIVQITALACQGAGIPADFETVRQACRTDENTNFAVNCRAVADVGGNASLQNPADGINFQGDKIHLTPAGYGIAAPLVVTAINKALPPISGNNHIGIDLSIGLSRANDSDIIGRVGFTPNIRYFRPESVESRPLESVK